MANLILPRRRFLTGLATLFAAPAIVRVSSLMPIRPEPEITMMIVRPSLFGELTSLQRQLWAKEVWERNRLMASAMGEFHGFTFVETIETTA